MTRFDPRLPNMDTVPDMIERMCCSGREVNPKTLERVLWLAVEIAREGREGRKIGTLFVIGDSSAVENLSRPLILDPLHGHPDEHKRITDPDLRETVKELAQLDGGFIVTDGGIVRSGARYFYSTAMDVDVPKGLGTRHMAAASITKQTHAVAVVVSESSIVRLFDDGGVVSEILPELWMLRRHGVDLPGPGREQRTEGEVTVISRPSDAEQT